MRLKPISREAAQRWIRETHRHLKRPPVGDLFRVALSDGGSIVAVGMAGRPCRALQDGYTVEITRIASISEPTKNACSRLYGALRRAGEALGYVRFVSYTLEHESGTSLRAAGYFDDGLNRGGEYDCPSRRREPVEQSGPKRRWIYPPRSSGLWNDIKPLKMSSSIATLKPILP